jgi:CDP-paratose 2-epimerase
MRLLITGACGFVGSVLARQFATQGDSVKVVGLDNLSRPGSERNRFELRKFGVDVIHGDLRLPEDVDDLPDVDWVIDAAAQPSVLAGLGGGTSSRRLMNHNLSSTINLLEFCKQRKAGFVLLSTSRVYNVSRLAALPVRSEKDGFIPDVTGVFPVGLTLQGVSEEFSTETPISLYGATKLASESLALEYGEAFHFPVWINRCGVLAGAGQFGRPDQGILAFWIQSYLQRRPMEYIGFEGRGLQVRDFFHPEDLLPLIRKQMSAPGDVTSRVFNVAGGPANALSLKQLSDWCEGQFGPHPVTANLVPRPYDIPWLVLDCARTAGTWGWQPVKGVHQILDEIAAHARSHPDWLELSR